MFDFEMFLKVMLWLGAVTGLLLTLATAYACWYFHCTERGRLELIMMQYKEGATIGFKWRYLILLIVSVVGLFCFR